MSDDCNHLEERTLCRFKIIVPPSTESPQRGLIFLSVEDEVDFLFVQV